MTCMGLVGLPVTPVFGGSGEFRVMCSNFPISLFGDKGGRIKIS